MSREMFLELERRRCAAYDTVDREAFNQLLAEDYVHIHGVGGIVDKSRDEYMATMATKTPGLSTASRGDDVEVREYGGFAIVAGSLHMQIVPSDGSQKKEMRANALSVWRLVDEDWRLASFQVTPVVPR